MVLLIILVLFGLFLFVSIFKACTGLAPNTTKIRERKGIIQYETSPPPVDFTPHVSPFFFGAVAQQLISEYMKGSGELTPKELDWQLRKRVFELSCIAASKFDSLRCSVITLEAQLVALFLALSFLLWIKLG